MSSKDYFSDFSPKCMSPGGGFLSFAVAVTMYILIPLAGISLIAGVGAELSSSMGSDSLDIGMLLNEFAVYLRNLMVYSIPLIVLSVFVGLYEKGSYARIPFKFLSSLYLAIVLLMFTKGGHMDMVVDGSALGGAVDQITLVINIEAVIYILATIAALKGFLAFTEFSDNRKAYLERAAKNFNKKDRKMAKWTVFEDDDDNRKKRKLIPGGKRASKQDEEE